MASIGLEHIDPRTLVGELGVGPPADGRNCAQSGGRLPPAHSRRADRALDSREIDHLFAQIALLKQRAWASSTFHIDSMNYNMWPTA